MYYFPLSSSGNLSLFPYFFFYSPLVSIILVSSFHFRRFPLAGSLSLSPIILQTTTAAATELSTTNRQQQPLLHLSRSAIHTRKQTQQQLLLPSISSDRPQQPIAWTTNAVNHHERQQVIILFPFPSFSL